MARTQKLFGEVEPNDSMPTTVSIDYEDLLLVCNTVIDAEFADTQIAGSGKQRKNRGAVGDGDGGQRREKRRGGGSKGG